VVGRLNSLMFACLAWPLLVAQGPGFVPLFDGRSLAGWTAIGGKPGNWGVEDGCLVARGLGKDWLSTNRAYGDFVLTLEYRTGPAGNSGVLIRAPHRGDPSFEGMEIQILDDGAEVYRGLQPAQYSGSVYGVVASRRGAARPPGHWNAMTIRAEGSKIAVELNGTPVTGGDLADHPGALARHPGIRRSTGYIGLQSHGDPIRFRNIAIRELPGSRGKVGRAQDPPSSTGRRPSD